MKVLVVEDEHHIARAIKKGLELEKMVVDVAYNGLDGLDLATTNSYEVILLDLMLPEMGGLEVVANLRKSQIQTPVLILTARDQIGDKVSGLKVGADDYLTKPFAFEELLARVRALARRPKIIEEEIVRSGNVEINKSTYEVRINDIKTKLSLKEYQLLLYLARNQGKTVSKDQIIEHVWDYEADILPNTVEVYIKMLRSKNINIVTVRGFGYKLESTNV